MSLVFCLYLIETVVYYSRMKNFKPQSLVLTLALVSGCGAMKNLDTMQASTQDMTTTTHDLAKKTSNMADTTQHMDGTSNVILKYSDATFETMRMGGGLEARQHSLDEMEKASDQGAKNSCASEYLGSMEFQFWQPKLENKAVREQLMATAVRDFFKKVREYIIDRKSVPSLANPTVFADPRTKNLFALAASLHFINDYQTELLDKTASPPVSMLSMIAEGLKVKSLEESGKIDSASIPAYRKEVLRSEQDAVYILQVRQDFLKLSAVTLASSSVEGNSPSADQLKAVIALASQKGKWVPNFDARNNEQVDYDSTVLELALQTQIFLGQLSYPTLTDPVVNLLLGSMNVDGVNSKDTTRGAIVGRFKTALTSSVEQPKQN